MDSIAEVSYLGPHVDYKMCIFGIKVDYKLLYCGEVFYQGVAFIGKKAAHTHTHADIFSLSLSLSLSHTHTQSETKLKHKLSTVRVLVKENKTKILYNVCSETVFVIHNTVKLGNILLSRAVDT
jgi:hypothetical protein